MTAIGVCAPLRFPRVLAKEPSVIVGSDFTSTVPDDRSKETGATTGKMHRSSPIEGARGRRDNSFLREKKNFNRRTESNNKINTLVYLHT